MYIYKYTHMCIHVYNIRYSSLYDSYNTLDIVHITHHINRCFGNCWHLKLTGNISLPLSCLDDHPSCVLIEFLHPGGRLRSVWFAIHALGVVSRRRAVAHARAKPQHAAGLYVGAGGSRKTAS